VKIANQEKIFSDSKLITSTDFRGDGVEFYAQNEVCRHCSLMFFHLCGPIISPLASFISVLF
jgi:hypothetical protein